MIPALDGARPPYIPQLPPPPPPARPATTGPRFIGPVANTAPATTVVPVDLNTTANANSGPSFAKGLQGTQPQPGDLLFAKMANDSYSLPKGPGQGTGNQSEADLKAAGWTRLQADGNVMKTADGKQVQIDPASLEDGSTGFRAAIYSDGKGHYVVAYAGTDPSQLGDVKADLGQGTGMETGQYDQAIDLARHVQSVAGPGNVAFTGHSLGGGLAAAASAATGGPAVTFNAAGVSNETLRRVGFANPNDARADFKTNGQIRSYSVDGDLLSTVDANGAPTQLGAQWHVAWHDPKGDISNPGNLLQIHGGSGDGQSYVQALTDSRPQPGVVQNPWVSKGLDAVLAPFGPAAELTPVRGAAITEIGTAGTAIRGTLDDLIQIGGRTGADVRADAKRGDPLAFLRMDGDLQKGGFDTAGSVLDRTGDFAGGTVTNLTDHAGEGIRDLGGMLGLPKGATNLAARPVEYTGDLARDGLNLFSDGGKATLDATGSVVDWTTDKVADDGDTAVKLADNAVDWGQHQVSNAVDAGKDLVSSGLSTLGSWL